MGSDYASLLQKQQQYFASGVTLDEQYRRERLQQLMIILQQNEDALCSAIAEDFGKSTFDSFTTELGMIYSEIKWQLKHLHKMMKPLRVPCNLINFPATFRIHPHPLGSVLIIGAWNYPLHLALLPAVDAIAAGCTCIIKPSDLTTATTTILCRLINNYFPKEYLHAVTGDAEETQRLIRLPFDKIFFTGSPRVGQLVYQAAAERMIPVTLELGGKSPVIVTQHADLAVAAKRIAWGKCINAGQTCVAPDYIVVHTSVHRQLVALLAKEMSKPCYNIDGEAYCKIINMRHFHRLQALLQPYTLQSNHILCGGFCDEQQRHIAPTVIDNVQWSDTIMQEEIFGPLLPVLTYDDLPSLLQQLSAKDKPLSAYLFSNSHKEQQFFTRTFAFGGGCINDVVMHLTNPSAPFGGVGRSGIGNYHGRNGFLCFTHQKSVMSKPIHGELPVKYPPYSAGLLRWLKKLM